MLFFFLLIGRSPRSTLFPYTTLFRPRGWRAAVTGCRFPVSRLESSSVPRVSTSGPASAGPLVDTDRKSTRLNSSHRQTAYAVFCLKKKNNDNHAFPLDPHPALHRRLT